LRGQEFTEILAPIIGPCTDPGIRGAKQASIDYYGSEYKIMSSMILYKQMAISSIKRIFALSPCIRLEPEETVSTGRHLTEFRQVDIEEADAKIEDSMQLAEKMLHYVAKRVKESCGKELEILERDLKVPEVPFKRVPYEDALRRVKELGFEVPYGEEIPWEAEEALSKKFEDPFFIVQYPKAARGFYYIEDSDKQGILRDFDLLYPEGFGEAVSGGEREYRFKAMKGRMEALGDDPSKYEWYMQMLKQGIPPSSGFGIGVERLTRYICGLETIHEAVAFPKLAGVISP
jgi:asparaginyl-tRNA synthetase